MTHPIAGAICVLMVCALSACATTSSFNDFCLKEKEREPTFVQQVKYPIDGLWEDVDHSDRCTTSFRIEKGIVYEVQNRCSPECSNNPSYVALQRLGPGKYSARAQYRARNLPFYDRAATIRVIDEDTLLVRTEARAGMASSRFFLKQRQLADRELFEQDLPGAGGEELRKQAVVEQKNLERCLGQCGGCEYQCAGPLLQGSAMGTSGALFAGQMGSAQCQEDCYRACSNSCERNNSFDFNGK